MHCRSCLLAIAIIVCAGCSDSPRSYPYVLREEWTQYPKSYPFDIDGDGDDEYYYVLLDEARKGRDTIVGHNLSGWAYDQFNLSGKLAGSIFPADFDGDRTEELLAPVLRNDSLFLEIISFDAAKNRAFRTSTNLLLTRPPSAPKDAVWDPVVNTLFKGVLGPGLSEELILGLSTGYGLTPRGLSIVSLPDFSLRDSLHTGALLRFGVKPQDFDRDGRLEIVMGSFAVGNGASARGSVDSLAYFFGMDLADLSIRWQRLVGKKRGEASHVLSGNFLGDERAEVVSYIIRKMNEPHLEILDPLMGETLTKHVHTAAIVQVLAVNATGDEYDDLLFRDAQFRLYLASGNLESIREIELPVEEVQNVEAIDDFIEVGRSTVIVSSASRTLFLDEQLVPIAALPHKISSGAQLMRVASTGSPLLSIHRNGQNVFYHVEHNPYYWFFKYWPSVAAFLVLGTLSLPFLLARHKINSLRQRLGQSKDELSERDAEIQRLDETQTIQEKTIEDASTRIGALSRDLASLQGQILEHILPHESAPVFDQLRAVLDKHALDADFNAGAFADRMGYSNRHHIRLVQDATGLKPADLIAHYRIEHAKTLLREGELSVTQVAYESGFKSPAFFSTKFQELVGCRPSEFRDDTTQDIKK